MVIDNPSSVHILLYNK